MRVFPTFLGATALLMSLAQGQAETVGGTQSSPNWNGLYLGGALGHRSQELVWTALGTGLLDWDETPPFQADEDDLDFGAHLGRLYRLDNGIVLGWELGWNNTSSAVSYTGGPAGFNGTWVSELDNIATLTGRIGRDMGPLLPYVELGIAGAEVKVSNSQPGLCAGQDCASDLGGWTPGIVAGLGVDYRITDQISLGLSYRHVRFPEQRTSLDLPIGNVISEEEFYLEGQSDIFAARFTYHFN